MPTFRTKPLEVEAFKWDGNRPKAPQWIVDAINLGDVMIFYSHPTTPERRRMTIDDPHNRAQPGDYIIHEGLSGRIYFLSSEKFEQRFYPIAEGQQFLPISICACGNHFMTGTICKNCDDTK